MLPRKQNTTLIVRFPIIWIKSNGFAQERLGAVVIAICGYQRLRKHELSFRVLWLPFRPFSIILGDLIEMRSGLIQHAAQEQVRLLNRWIDLNDFQKRDDGIFEAAL